jgi:hypothetical protein
MDDERWAPGMPVLDRQAVPVRRTVDGRLISPSRVPETRPTPLQRRFIEISAVALVAGTVAISAWELGQPLGAPLVRWPAVLGALLLAAVTADAAVRFLRSVRAWSAIDRGRAAFRLIWVGVALIAVILELGAASLVLLA